jgi:cytochrome P450
MELKQRFGDIFQFKLIDKQTIGICDAEVAKCILTSNDFPREDSFERAAVGIFDHVLAVLPTGEEWYRHRKFLQPAFAPLNLNNAKETVDLKIVKAVELWRERDGEVLNFFHEIGKVSLDIIGLMAFGHDFDTINCIENKEGEYLDTMFEAVALRFAFPQYLWSLLKIDNKQPSLIKAKLHFKILLDQVIDDRRQKVAIEFGTLLQKDWNILDRLLYSNINDNVIHF